MLKYVLFLPMLLSALGCQARVVAVEVLPPRTSATCSAPGLNAAAGGRGLLDLDATENFHGAYVADVRVTARDGDLSVDGAALAFELPDGVSGGSETVAKASAGAQASGALFLPFDDSDPVSGIIQDVRLLPRELAEILRDDDNLDADDVVFATVDVTVRVTSAGEVLEGASVVFPIDVCRGCLVAEPTDDDCPDGFEDSGACRLGQDVPIHVCSDPPGGGAPVGP